MAALTRRIALLASLVVASLTLAACGQDGIGNARAACRFVDRGISLYDQSTRTTDLATQQRLRDLARSQFLQGVGLAGAANSQSGQWNALMTTLTEASRVPVGNLVPTLRRQCRIAESNGVQY